MGQDIEIKRSVCMWCHSHCSVDVHVQNGRLVKLDGAKGHPLEKLLTRVVRACPRARLAPEWLYHPDRLSYPMKRAGEKGEGKWQRISWDQALDGIADKIKAVRRKYGPEGLATSEGTLRTHDEYRMRFLNLFGTPNCIGEGHICWGVNNVVASMINGWPSNYSPFTPETKCIMVMGANPAQAYRNLWYLLLEAQARGTKLIVVDPRFAEPAQRADLWLQVRPGTDCALLMGMINVIISEGLYDKQFVDKWCYGFDKLRERAKEYPLDKVAQITWVPAEKVRQAALMYANNRPAICYNEMGLEHLTTSVEALHARYILPAITGNVDVPGGEIHRGHPFSELIYESEIEMNEMLGPEQRKKALGIERFKLMCYPGYELIEENVERVWGKQIPKDPHFFAHTPTLVRAVVTGKPYPVRAMITLASNPMVTLPNTKLVYKALKSLDLYVVMDFFMTPGAQLADYVLPSLAWLERPFMRTMRDLANFLQVGEAAVPGNEAGQERRTDFDFWLGLAIRLGQKKYWPWKTLEEAYDYRLAPLGYTVKDFVAKKGGYQMLPLEHRKFERQGFATPTGKVELYSTILEKLGYDPLPKHREPAESPYSAPELAREYPLVLTTGGRHQPFYHSEWRQVESARKQHPHPLVQVNPKTAQELGIEDGDWIWIETPRGRVRQKCQYFEGIDPRVVHAQHGWWLPELPGEEPWLHGAWESNINVVTDDDPDSCNLISGGWPLRGELCKIYRVKTY